MSLLSLQKWWLTTGLNTRGFYSSARNMAKSTKQRLKFEHCEVPPYPYGPSQIYKQSNFGLYGTQKIRFGNMVSEKNEIKTRRYWRPNVHVKDLYSESLGRKIPIRITTRVLRTLRKVGGLDEYLLGEKSARIKELGMNGWKLRWQIMQTPKIKERFRKQRQELGLPPLEEDILKEQNKKMNQDDTHNDLEQLVNISSNKNSTNTSSNTSESTTEAIVANNLAKTSS